MKNDEMTNLINELKKDPLFAMSLSSKELFHSNFWAWLFDRNTAYARIFFPDLRDYDVPVKREQNNRDLTIWSGGKAYIIENKFKSFPTLAQLAKYQNDLKAFEAGVLTGIQDPGLKLADKWRFISYKDICAKIRKTADEVENNEDEKDEDEKDCPFEKELIIRYAKMFSRLSEAVSGLIDKNENRWTTNLGLSGMEELRMDDVIKKHIAAKLAAYLEEKLADRFRDREPGPYKLVFGTGYSRKEAAVDAFFEQTTDDRLPNRIGVQIQGSQFRWCVVKEPRLKDEERKALFEKFVKCGWFFDYVPKKKNEQKLIRGRITSLSKRFGCYGESEKAPDTFIYQYWTIDAASATFEALSKEVGSELDRAAELILALLKEPLEN